uniref:RIIa domain-containing protein n=2 Tax=Guillardia theta TaxID=55529 RepID=A0A7S4L9A9_GUITH|mmetsp:Transcript_40242/g.126686  ORF Transcript_40242/g.126686 Transcript_40242/m.126686 type:complete len:189 (+) Transcript_40242:397-963(+)
MVLDNDPIYCAEQINIPENLGEILKAYAKEVIRSNPSNIYEFSAKYFAQLDQNAEEEEIMGEEVSKDAIYRLVLACKDDGSPEEERDINALIEMAEQSDIPRAAISQALDLVSQEGSNRVSWKHLVVTLCSQVGGVEDVTQFVGLLMDPGMFGDDDGKIQISEFITLFDWWSTIDERCSLSRMLTAVV